MPDDLVFHIRWHTVPVPAPRSPVRTYHARAGRLSPASRRALAELLPQLTLDVATASPWPFGADTPVVLEIGSGMGEATVEMARADPSTRIVAVEVHRPGVAALLRQIERERLTNVTVLDADAISVLQDMVPSGALAGIRSFFPDPWPKKRHHKRRLFRPELVSLMADRLAIGGVLHAATDWSEYAGQMVAVLDAEPRMVNKYAGFAPRPIWRPVTRFEQRGLRLGHQVHDVMFRRVDPPVSSALG